MDSNETIKQAVMAGLGISLISGHTVAEELRSGRLVQLNCEGLPIMRKWFLLARPGKPLTAVAREVRDWIVDHKEQFFPVPPEGDRSRATRLAAT
jgi:DNA-binding transcriptional LysR family regulator